jgi:hypothetical protein
MGKPKEDEMNILKGLTTEDQQLLIDVARAISEDWCLKSAVRHVLDPSMEAIWWGVGDMKMQADQRGGEQVYDYDKIPEAFRAMMGKHDACHGISWETIDAWLDMECKK